MVPFLAKELHLLLIELCEKFVCKSVVENISDSVESLLKVDLNQRENQKAVKFFHLCFAARDIISSSNVSEVKLVEYKKIIFEN